MNQKDILNILVDAGYVAYLCGGCVRDYLIGRKTHDIDIATSATPDQIKALFPKTLDVGAKFGTCVVVTDTGNYEITTFRSDMTGGRHPEVKLGVTPEQDSSRRDFTINSMFMDIDGNTIDYQGGIKDLQDKVLRAVGNPKDRFLEDSLRILRAARLAAELGFMIDDNTESGMAYNVSGLSNISSERIRDELTKGLCGADPEMFLIVLDLVGALDVLLPDLGLLMDCEQSPEQHPEGNVWKHTMLMLKPNDSPEMAWSCLLHDIAKPLTKGFKGEKLTFYGHDKEGAKLARKILSNLKFSNEFIDTVSTVVGNHMDHCQARNMKGSTFKRMVSRPTFELEFELHRRDAMASNGDLSTYLYIGDRKAALPATEIKPDPLVGGQDLMSAGMKPGPDFKARLVKAYDTQLEGGDKAACLAAAMA